jgi:cell division protein FtsZ
MMNEHTVTNSQEVESIVEDNIQNDYEQSFSEEVLNAHDANENGESNLIETEYPSNGLENFSVEGESAPDLFSSENESSETESLQSSKISENDLKEDDLEIPAFLRRQKN